MAAVLAIDFGQSRSYHWEITTLDHDFFEDGPLGPSVPEHLLERVVRSVRRALGEVVPEP